MQSKYFQTPAWKKRKYRFFNVILRDNPERLICDDKEWFYVYITLIVIVNSSHVLRVNRAVYVQPQWHWWDWSTYKRRYCNLCWLQYFFTTNLFKSRKLQKIKMFLKFLGKHRYTTLYFNLNMWIGRKVNLNFNKLCNIFYNVIITNFLIIVNFSRHLFSIFMKLLLL